MQVIRQGDVVLIPVEGKSPKKEKDVKPENGRHILAHGEVTGHAHALELDEVEFFETKDKRRFLNVKKDEAELKHEEHGTVTIPCGIWEVRRQREYSPEEIRPVAD